MRWSLELHVSLQNHPALASNNAIRQNIPKTTFRYSSDSNSSIAVASKQPNDDVDESTMMSYAFIIFG